MISLRRPSLIGNIMSFNLHRFWEVMQNPRAWQATDEAEAVLEKYPYFQLLHTLVAKVKHDQQTPDAYEALGKAAVYAPDRRRLRQVFYDELTLDLPEADTAQPLLIPDDSTYPDAVASDSDHPGSGDADASAVDQHAPAREEIDTDEVHTEITEASTEDKPESDSSAPTADRDEAEIAASEESVAYPEPLNTDVVDTIEEAEDEAPAVGWSEAATDQDDTTAVAPDEAEPFVNETPDEDTPNVEAAATVEDEPPVVSSEIAEESGRMQDEQPSMIITSGETTDEYSSATTADPEETASTQDEPSAASDETAGGAIREELEETLRKLQDSKERLPDSTEPPTAATPDDPSETDEVTASTPQQIIIDRFMRANPSISREVDESEVRTTADLSEASGEMQDGVVTENLAEIMLKQGKEERAVDLYEKLMLKYPEKKAYFAEKINQLKKNQ